MKRLSRIARPTGANTAKTREEFVKKTRGEKVQGLEKEAGSLVLVNRRTLPAHERESLSPPVLLHGAVALLGGGARVVRRLGRGRGRRDRLAALGVRVPLPVVGAGGDGRRGVLGNAAALSRVPVPGAGAVVAAGRERRGRRATVGAASGAGRPPELAVVAVVTVSGSRGLAGPGARRSVSMCDQVESVDVCAYLGFQIHPPGQVGWVTGGRYRGAQQPCPVCQNQV